MKIIGVLLIVYQLAVSCGQFESYCCWRSDPTICYNVSPECDGSFDCPGGEDESFCGDFHLPDENAYCCSTNSTHCIDQSMECDGAYDCPGGDDEFFCGIPLEPICASKDQQYCAEDASLCMQYEEVCDGKEDCPHGSDEFQCHEFCPLNCVSCSRLELVCLGQPVWNYTEVLEVQDTVPNVKSVIFVGTGGPGSSEFSLSAALGNDTMQYIRLITSGTFANLKITSLTSNDFIYFERLILLVFAGNDIRSIPSNTFSSLDHLKELYLSKNNIEDITKDAFPRNLKLIALIGNKIKVLTPDMFQGMLILTQLNLKDNLIARIESDAFRDLANLENLNLENNLIASITASSFSGLDNLQYLHLTNNSITHLSNETFRHLPNLKYIDLSYNPLKFIEGGTFSYISQLKTLLIQSTELEIKDKDIVQGLSNLDLLVADNFGICCLLSPNTECNTPPSAFATCDGIFRTPMLRTSAWIVSMCALGGNLLVLVMRTRNRRQFGVFNPANIQHRFISNLAFADLLMGLYLFILAIADASFGSDYFLYSIDWRRGFVCKTIGFIGVLSSLASILILSAITLDRFLCLVFPFGKVHFHSKSAYVTIALIWFGATVLALTPVLLSQRLDGFYGLSDVCLGLPLVTDAKEVSTEWVQDDISGYGFIYVESAERHGWVYSRILFTYFNALCVIVITTCYTVMFFSVRKSARISQRSETTTQEIKMAARMALIVGTDMLCWVPIIILGIISQFGINIPVAVYAWIVIFILPINSAVNPFIFTFSSYRRKRKPTTTMTSGAYPSNSQPSTGIEMGRPMRSSVANSANVYNS